jgi:hypothetical protein
MVLRKANSQGRRYPQVCTMALPPDQKRCASEPSRVLTPEAKRALAEAEERRRLADARHAASPRPKEVGGSRGPDPTRYGDWEKNGIASDF